MPNSVGTAYLTLVPSMQKGWKSKMQTETDSYSKTGGKKSGGVFGKAFAAGFKALGALGIGAAAVDMVSQSVKASAEFEQLTGGVEKIFDQMDSSKIIEDSKGAWKSLNMSANDYLESINDVGAAFSATMGDEKAYETAKKGLQAISDFSSGTGKDLDTLTDKYTLITRSTSSYQSIADQFSGILPATSADFLKQAQAAGDLSNEYDKLTQVPIEEYQQAVTSALARGTAALGLSGNTAAETEKTMSGSIAGMQASWQNWLTTIGDPDGDVEKATQDLADSIVAAMSNLIPLLGRIFAGIGRSIKAQVTKSWNSVTSFLSQKASETGIYRTLVGVPNAAKKAFEELKNNAKSGIDGAFQAVRNVGNSIKSFIGGIKLQLPRFKLPHLSVSGGKAPWGIAGQGSLPKFSVSWYAKGGLFGANSPSLIGVGDNKRYDEAVLPLSPQVLAGIGRGIAANSNGGGVVINLNYSAGSDANQMVRDIAHGLKMRNMLGA